MPRKEKFPYSHDVRKTGKDHKCELCDGIIPKGSSARYKNLFTGKRGYIHQQPCPKGKLSWALQVERVRGYPTLYIVFERENGRYKRELCVFWKDKRKAERVIKKLEDGKITSEQAKELGN